MKNTNRVTVAQPIMTLHNPTEEMHQAVSGPVVECRSFSDVHGLMFLTLTGGEYAIYNVELKQVLKRRFTNLQDAINFAKVRLCSPIC